MIEPLRPLLIRTSLLSLLLFCLILPAKAFQAGQIVTFENGEGRFLLSSEGETTAIWLDEKEEKGVKIAVNNFQEDLKEVTGNTSHLLQEKTANGQERLVIIGTIGHSAAIDQLIRTGKLDVAGVADKWENYLIQTIDAPMEGVKEALVIAGSDKRGTIFGIYEMSRQIGVSPWHWWADVPVHKQEKLFVIRGRLASGTPAVQYRGIFINDEAPALSGWAHEKFGGFNHQFYAKVYELILRLKGNFLWPAMWGRSLYEDDPKNPELADDYGVVIGTSHHEPLMRAHVDWERNGEGPWDYTKNKENLQEFWREGIQRMGDNESLVTIGMRGDGDEPMSEGANIALLEKIVADQRELIAEVTGKPAEQTPQVWALYKEVQEYYDKGMRVPDDVTLLLCDDNYGNVRKLPKLGEKQHQGGYGMYYHFDYVGGPRNYKWINTNHIPRIWEQMHLTYQHGVDKIWVVNVGDIKPMELPISFFLDYAWNPEKWPAERLQEYVVTWAEEQFGAAYKVEIADLLDQYTKFNARRKPELVDAKSYSMEAYDEFDRVVKEYSALARKAEEIQHKLADAYQSAYYQLVLYPILASANLYEMYYEVAKNARYAQQGRATTNATATKAKALFEHDAELAEYHNKQLEGGKWNHMMDQVHIGYTSWNDPPEDIMPEVVEIEVPEKGALGVALNTGDFYPEKSNLTHRELTPFDTDKVYIELFNRGKGKLEYHVAKKPDWLQLSPESGVLEGDLRLFVDVDWKKLPEGKETGLITISAGKETVDISLPVRRFTVPDDWEGFVESGGYVSMEAAHFTGKQTVFPYQWRIIPNLGKTGSSITGLPVRTQEAATEHVDTYVSYSAYFTTPGTHTLRVHLAPTLNYVNSKEGLRFGISVDEEPPAIISMHEGRPDREWYSWAGDAVNITTCEVKIDKPGVHEIKLWLVDTGVVVQKMVIDTGGLKKSYLGPPESYFNLNANP